jgi:cellulose synthase (UDP-forming)
MTTLARIQRYRAERRLGLYSLIFLLAAIAVARETRQVRKTIRIDVNIPVLIHYASGIVSQPHRRPVDGRMPHRGPGRSPSAG